MKMAVLMKYSLIVLALLVILGVGQSYITCLLGVAYPAFQSFCILESNNGQLEKQWLTYWVVIGIFEVVDHFAGFILAIIPFYYVLKMFVIIYLFHPSTHGATFVYDNYLRSHFVEVIKRHDSMTKEAMESFDAAKNEAMGYVDAAKSKVGLGKARTE